MVTNQVAGWLGATSLKRSTWKLTIGPTTTTAERFGPTWVLVSAGFDGHRDDPLADMALSAGDYADLAGPVLALAPPGRRLAFLEGGYDLDALARSAGACVASMAGVDYRPEAPTSGEVGREAVEAAARLVGQGGGSGRRWDQSME